MQMRPEIQIQSILKAMSDVVMPALDPGNKLAQEQAKLCMGLLALMAQQLPLQFRFDCDELARLIELARALGPQGEGGIQGGEALSALQATAQNAAAVLERARADPAEVLEAVRSLRAATGAVVKAVYENPDSTSVAAVQRTVLASAKEQLLRDRSMLLMQNWEMAPQSIPPLRQLLGLAPAPEIAR